MCFTVMNVGLRLPMYLLSQSSYVFHSDECRTEIVHIRVLTFT